MSKLFNTTLRINLSDPEGLKAWTYLVNRDKSRYRSYSDAIIAAVNGYFDREARLADDPYLETREKEDAFLQKVLETVERGAQANPLAASPRCCRQFLRRHRITPLSKTIWIRRWISSTDCKTQTGGGFDPAACLRYYLFDKLESNCHTQR